MEDHQEIYSSKRISKKRLLDFDIDHLLTLIESKKEREIALKLQKQQEEQRKALEEIDMDDNGEIIASDKPKT